MAPQRQGHEEDTGMRPRLATSLGGESQVFVVDGDGQAETAETPSGGASTRGKSAEDDELTSLTWLQDCNLLQSIHVSGDAPKGQVAHTRDGSQISNGVDEEEDYQLNGISSGTSSPVAGEVYNPTVHIYAKPPYSFSCLIFMAIEDSTTKALPVKDIYSWILSHFPYFQNAPTGWKNSVRHNLSLNKCFLKVDKGQNIAKGSLWRIESVYRPNLLQALNKMRYSQFRHLRLPTHLSSLVSSISQNQNAASPSSKPFNNTPNPDLFPFLSKRLGTSKTKDPEVDAAATMLALKNGPRILKSKGRIDTEKSTNGTISPTKERRLKRLQDRSRVPRNLPALVVDGPVITMSPSEDHTYSSTSSPHHGNSSSPTSSIDEPFEFGHSAVDPLSDIQDHFSHRSDSGGDSGVTHSTTSTSDESMEDDDEDYNEIAVERGNRVIVLPVSDGDRAKSLSEQCYLVERPPPGRARVARADDEERKKIAEGADALLNLAGYRTAEAKPRRRRKPSRGNLRHIVFDEAQR